MAYQIKHYNSLNCDITDMDTSEIFNDETEAGDRLIAYVKQVDIYVGDRLVMVEVDDD